MKNLLIKTQEAFDAWRSQGHRNYNEHLRNQAVECLAYDSYIKVGKAIGIAPITLRIWQNKILKSKETTVIKPSFLEVSLNNDEPFFANINQTLPTLQLLLPNGIQITAGQIDPRFAADFILALSRGLG